MLTANQEQALTSFGDCFEHYHSADRIVTQDTVSQFQQVWGTQPKTAPYTLTAKDNVILVSGGGTIILPLSKNSCEFEVIMTSDLLVTVQLSGSDLIYGESSVLMTVKGMALHFKAIPGGWVII